MASSKSRPSSNYAQAKRRSGSKGSPVRGRQASATSPNRGPLVVLVTVIVIAAIITGFILIKVNSNSSSSSSANGVNQPVPAAVANAVANVPNSALVQAGTSSAIPLTQAVQGSATPLTSNGKPEILYIGAEFCPFCAAERWAMVSALSKFGTFTNLHLMRSSSSDAYPNTPTFTFYHSNYTSNYVSFVSREWSTRNKTSAAQNFNGYSLLQVPTKAEQKLFGTYDNAPYVSTANAGSIPFIDFGNKYLQIGASYVPSALQGLSWQTIAGSLSLPTSTVGQEIDQTTNVLIATICKLTNNQPSSACSTSVVKSLEAQLGS